MENYQIRYHAGKLMKALPSITAVASYVKKEDGAYIVRCVNGIATLKRLATAVAGGLYTASELVALAKDALAMIDTVQPPSDAPMVALPKIGDRIRLRHDVDRYPHFVAKEGAYGTVTEVEFDSNDWGNISAKMDDHLDSCEEWDNSICWNSDMANDPNEPLAEIFAYDAEVLKEIPSSEWPVEEIEGRLNDKEWPCGMRVRFKRPYGVGSGFVAEGTVATVVWWSPDIAAVKLDRLATMHGDGEVIEWEATRQKCIWDDVEEVTDKQMCERCGEVETGAVKFCNDCMEEIAYNKEQANPSDGLGY